jgi:hypothetical protein
MAKILKATILMLSEAPDGQPGVAGKAVAKYIVGDDGDPSINQVKIKEVSAADLARPADVLFAEVVASLKNDEGVA